jgi:hypothetical protein
MRKYFSIILFTCVFIVYITKSIILNKNLGFGLGDIIFHLMFIVMVVSVFVLYILEKRNMMSMVSFRIFSYIIIVVSLYLFYILTIGEGVEGGW